MSNQDLQTIEAAAAAPKSQHGLAKRWLWETFGDSLERPIEPDSIRSQLPALVVRDVEIICERFGLEDADLKRLALYDAGVSAAVLARLANPETTDPVGDIRRDLAELCHQ